MATPSAAATLRDRIGGRWAISWLTYVTLVVATGVAVALSAPGSPAAWAAIVAASGGSACMVLALADVTVLRHRRVRPAPVAVVVGVGVLVGAVRGGMVLATASVLGVNMPRAAAVVVVGSVFLATATVVGVALLYDAVERQRSEQAALVARLAALQELTGEGADLAEAMRDAALAEMMATLDVARAGIEVPVGEMTVDDRLAVASDLRRTVDEQLRPLSHRLYAASHQFEPVEPTGLRVLDASLRRQAIFPLTTALLAMVVLGAFAEFVVVPLVVGAVVWSALSLVVLAARRWPRLRRHQMVVGLPAAGVSAAASLALARWAMGAGTSGWMLLGVGATVMFIAAPASIIGALLFDDTTTTRLIEEVDARQVESMAINRELARTSRDLAQYVHGTLQANLLTIGFVLERAAANNDDVAFAQAVADARAALAQGPPVDAHAPGLAEVLADVAAQWRGFVVVDVRIADSAERHMPAARVADIGRIVGEAIANARKHGGARHAQVWVGMVDGADLGLMVTDDGTGPGHGVKGMGSTWLDFVARDAWHLGPGPAGHGTRLEVRFPLATPAGATVGER